MWQHVQLCEQIRPWDTPACCWDVKQPTNKNPGFALVLSLAGLYETGRRYQLCRRSVSQTVKPARLRLGKLSRRVFSKQAAQRDARKHSLASLSFPVLLACTKQDGAISWEGDPGTQLGQHAPQGSASLLPKLSVTSKVSAPTSCAWVGSWVHFRSSEDVTLLEFTSPVDREYMRRRRKFHWI